MASMTCRRNCLLLYFGVKLDGQASLTALLCGKPLDCMK